MAKKAKQLSELNGFQRDLLFVLSSMSGEPSGAQLKKEAERQMELDEINHGRLYPNLDSLLEAGFIDKGKKDRRTNYYKVNGRGTRVLQKHIRWERELSGL